MKKLLLISAGTLLLMPAMAQNRLQTSPFAKGPALSSTPATVASKTSATGDTITYQNFDLATDTASIYLYNGTNEYGYRAGMNNYGDMGFAERYNFTSADSSLSVIGMLTYFAGTIAPASSKSVNLRAWAKGPKTGAVGFADTVTHRVDGYPTTILATQSVPFTMLGNATGSFFDSITVHFFTTPTAYIADSFFVGYTVTYDPANLAGDTITLVTSDFDDREGPYFSAAPADTTIFVANAVQWDDGVWHEEKFENGGLTTNYFVFPILKVGNALGLSNNPVSQKGLSFYGAFPNPANHTMNVRIALENSADVTVNVMDMSGRILSSQVQSSLAAGQHIMPVSTSALASGTYIYSVTTSKGAGVGATFMVQH